MVLNERLVKADGRAHCLFIWWPFADRRVQRCESCSFNVPVADNLSELIGSPVDTARC